MTIGIPSFSKNPSRLIRGIYRIGLSNLIGGGAAAFNIMSLTNPVGSGRLIFVLRGLIMAGAVDTATNNIHSVVAGRSGDAAAGADISATITRRSSADPAPIGVARNGPTGTFASQAYRMPSGTHIPFVGESGFSPQNIHIVLDRDYEEIELREGESWLHGVASNSTGYVFGSIIVWAES